MWWHMRSHAAQAAHVPLSKNMMGQLEKSNPTPGQEKEIQQGSSLIRVTSRIILPYLSVDTHTHTTPSSTPTVSILGQRKHPFLADQ